eukprot:UN21362
MKWILSLTMSDRARLRPNQKFQTPFELRNVALTKK